MIRKVKLVTVTVLNPQRSLEFYRDKIGLRVLVDDRHDDGSRWIELVTPDGGTGIALVESQAGDKVGTFSNIMFSCDNIYNTYHDLRSRGVDFAGPPDEQSWGTFLVFKDPDGNSFVIGS